MAAIDEDLFLAWIEYLAESDAEQPPPFWR